MGKGVWTNESAPRTSWRSERASSRPSQPDLVGLLCTRDARPRKSDFRTSKGRSGKNWELREENDASTLRTLSPHGQQDGAEVDWDEDDEHKNGASRGDCMREMPAHDLRKEVMDSR